MSQSGKMTGQTALMVNFIEIEPNVSLQSAGEI